MGMTARMDDNKYINYKDQVKIALQERFENCTVLENYVPELWLKRAHIEPKLKQVVSTYGKAAYLEGRPWSLEVSCFLDYEGTFDYVTIFSKRNLQYWPNAKAVAERLDDALATYA